METEKKQYKSFKDIDNSRKPVFCYTSNKTFAEEVESLSKIRIIDGKKTMSLRDYADFEQIGRHAVYYRLKMGLVKSIKFGYQQFIILE